MKPVLPASFFMFNGIIMKHLLSFISLLLFAMLILNGCLTLELKEYKIEIKSDKSGSGYFKFINILSHNYSGEDSLDSDFSELINDYLQGSKLEEEMPKLKIKSKKLIEEDGKLSGIVEFEFDHINDIGLYQYNDESPIMYFVNVWNENYVESNGKYDSEIMPVIFWEKDTKEIELKTTIAGEVDPDDPAYISLLDYYKKWKRK